MAENTENESNDFLVVVLGSTGVGKSKLAIEIAQSIGGEIISADSMQIHKGLDIITNKVTAEEQELIPHHMINIVEPREQFTVVQFRDMSLALIDDMQKRGRVPIIVGGTNYYIESLLWRNLIDSEKRKTGSEENDTLDSGEVGAESCANNADIECCSELENENCAKNANESEECCSQSDAKNCASHAHEDSSLYQKLTRVDPEMARRHHPNDTRKIARSLQVFEQSGIRHSELLAQQHSEQGASGYGGPLRFKNTCVLWLRCDMAILDRRLDTRVDKMVEQGLLSEMLQFHKRWRDSVAGNTHGIFQSIGFKEFAPFLASEEADKNGELFQKCVDLMKTATRRYARKQTKWVRHRFLGRPKDCTPDVYALDATDLTKWDSVLKKALSIVGQLKTGKTSTESPLERIQANIAGKRAYHHCDVCDNRVIIGDQSWDAHLKSKSHRHHKKKIQKQS